MFSFSRSTLSVGLTLTALSLSSLVMAQVTITDGSASYTNPSTTLALASEPAGTSTVVLADFRPNGGATTDQVYASWFWHRINSGVATPDTRELGFRQGGTFTSATRTSTANSITLNLVDSRGLTFQTVTTLTDNPNVDTAKVNYATTITNTSGNTITGSYFHYIDFYLNGADATDLVTLGGTNELLVSDTASPTYKASFVGVGASGYRAGSYTAVSGNLTDAAIDNFTDNVINAPSGDNTGAFQWDYSLAPGASITLNSRFAVVPAPSSVAVMALGGLMPMVAIARRRRAKK